MNEEKDHKILSPLTGVIIRQHGENPVTPVKISGFTIVLDDEPAYAEYNDRIIKTLLQSLVNYFPVANYRKAGWL